MPKVSVIIPVYNREKLIAKTLDSVMAQDYQDFDVLVIDDGSTDKSGEVIRQYLAKYPGKISLTTMDNRGAASARNVGIDLAKGSLLAFIDSDDLWQPDKLNKQVLFLNNHPEIALVYSSYSIMHDERITTPDVLKNYYQTLPQGQILKDLLLRCFISTITVLVRKDAVVKNNGFDKTLRVGEDYDLWLRIARDNLIGCVSEVLAIYRHHDTNIMKTDIRNAEPGENIVVQNFVTKFPDSLNGISKRQWSERLAFPYFDRGYECFAKGDLRCARYFFWQAIKRYGGRLGLYKYLIGCYCPFLINFKKILKFKKTKPTIFIESMREEDQDGFFKKRLVFSIRPPKDIDLQGNELIFEYATEKIEATGDSAVFSLLPVAFWERADIELGPDIPVSMDIQENIDQICKSWNKFFDYVRNVKVFGGKRFNDRCIDNTDKKTGLLFSGGVDAMATFIDKEQDIDFLLYCFGADTLDSEKFAKIRKRLDELAKSILKKELLYYSTNIRLLTSVPWGWILHACAVISPILSLSNSIKKTIISSTHYDDIAANYAWGSSPKTDIHIRTNRVEVEHYGDFMRRIDKTRKISQRPELLQHCRVCYQETLEYNCGACEKCLRTMVVLFMLRTPVELLPFPPRYYSFPAIVSRLSQLGEFQIGQKIFWAEILQAINNCEFDVSEPDHAVFNREIMKFLGSFYCDYIERKHNIKFYQQLRYRRIGRRIERVLFFTPDTLRINSRVEKRIRDLYYHALEKISIYKG